MRARGRPRSSWVPAKRLSRDIDRVTDLQGCGVRSLIYDDVILENMKYIDRVYGIIDITEPVMLDLIASPALQRLKDVDQIGYRPFWFDPNADMGEYDNSRFAHSVGVALLLKKFGAPLAEQVAGLIHDVSHSAFSHCIDYALEGIKGEEQTHQDDIFVDFVRKTTIPEILHKHGLALDDILDDANFPLKERSLPDLCADRVDYALRTAVLFHVIGNQEANKHLDHLQAVDGKWVFADLASARSFAELFRRLNEQYYSSLTSAAMFGAVGACVQHCLQKKYVTMEELYTTDAAVLRQIKNHLNGDTGLQRLWKIMNHEVSVANNPDDYDVRVLCKSRVVDPWFFQNGEMKRFSEAERGWRETMKKESKPKEYFLKFGLKVTSDQDPEPPLERIDTGSGVTKENIDTPSKIR